MTANEKRAFQDELGEVTAKIAAQRNLYGYHNLVISFTHNPYLNFETVHMKDH